MVFQLRGEVARRGASPQQTVGIAATMLRPDSPIVSRDPPTRPTQIAGMLQMRPDFPESPDPERCCQTGCVPNIGLDTACSRGQMPEPSPLLAPAELFPARSKCRIQANDHGGTRSPDHHLFPR